MVIDQTVCFEYEYNKNTQNCNIQKISMVSCCKLIVRILTKIIELISAPKSRDSLTVFISPLWLPSISLSP